LAHKAQRRRKCTSSPGVIPQRAAVRGHRKSRSKIETEIADGPAVRSLIRASASAAMVCVGAVGLRHFHAGQVVPPLRLWLSRDDALWRLSEVVTSTADGQMRLFVHVDGSPDKVYYLGRGRWRKLSCATPQFAAIYLPADRIA